MKVGAYAVQRCFFQTASVHGCSLHTTQYHSCPRAMLTSREHEHSRSWTGLLGDHNADEVKSFFPFGPLPPSVRVGVYSYRVGLVYPPLCTVCFTVVDVCCPEVNVIGRSPDSAYSTPIRDNSTDEKSAAGANLIAAFAIVSE